MRVAIEGSTLFTKGYTGIPNYILCLYKALNKNDSVEITMAYHFRKFKKMNTNKTNLPHNWYLNSFLFSFDKKPQISHSLHTPFLKLNGTKKIATIHDLAVHLPEFESYNFSSEYFKNKRLRLFEDFSKNADAIIAVSENTKHDFLKFFDYPEDKIHVVHLAPVFEPTLMNTKNDEVLLDNLSLKKKEYYLTVGGVSLRKNSYNLLKGFHLSGKSNDYKLVFAGKIVNSEKDRLDKYINDNNLSNSIIFTNYISDENLSSLYRNSKSFLFPTFYEGFGIPIIEAMNYELPVLTSTTGAAPEIAKSHAVLVNPFDEKSIANGILKLDNHSKKDLLKAREYASNFNWDKVAAETINIYKSII